MNKSLSLVVAIGDQSPSPEAPFMSKKVGSKEDIRRGAFEKSWCVRFSERTKVRVDDPINYFLPTGVRSTF